MPLCVNFLTFPNSSWYFRCFLNRYLKNILILVTVFTIRGSLFNKFQKYLKFSHVSQRVEEFKNAVMCTLTGWQVGIHIISHKNQALFRDFQGKFSRIKINHFDYMRVTLRSFCYLQQFHFLKPMWCSYYICKHCFREISYI